MTREEFLFGSTDPSDAPNASGHHQRAPRGFEKMAAPQLAYTLLLLVLRGRRAVLLPLYITLGGARAGGVHRTIWLGTVRRSGLLHAGLRSRAGVLGKGRAAQEGKSGDGD